MDVIIKVAVTIILIGVFIFVGKICLYAMFYKKTTQGFVIIRNGASGSKVSFSGIFALPYFHVWEKMDISMKRIEIVREGKEGLVCKDCIRADITVTFFVRVNQTSEDILSAAKSLGCERAADPEILMEFFDAKFSEAIKTVGIKFDFVDLFTYRDVFKDEILQLIGTDLNGYVLDDAVIDSLDQTDISHLNLYNILDVAGIKKIVTIAEEHKHLFTKIGWDSENKIVQDVEAKKA